MQREGGSAKSAAIPRALFSATGVRESFLVTNFMTIRNAGGSDIALQSDGRMVKTGFTQNAADNFTQLAAARLVP